MNALTNLRAWLHAHELGQPPATTAARYLRSACCAAPVLQCPELDTALAVALCQHCGRELGAPGFEDLDARPVTPYDQWGCAGRHRGIGTPECPREIHHHHDRRCQPPMVVQAEQEQGST